MALARKLIFRKILFPDKSEECDWLAGELSYGINVVVLGSKRISIRQRSNYYNIVMQ